MDLRFGLPVVASAPRAARGALDGPLDHLPDDARERIRLALSELVTNVVQHGGLGEDQEMTVLVADGSGPVRVVVGQPTSAPASIVPRGARAGTDGHGLRMVDVLVDRWGVSPEPPGAVWFEVDP